MDPRMMQQGGGSRRAPVVVLSTCWLLVCFLPPFCCHTRLPGACSLTMGSLLSADTMQKREHGREAQMGNVAAAKVSTEKSATRFGVP